MSGTDDMTTREKEAYTWAMHQNYTSVAANHAGILAHYIHKARSEYDRLKLADETLKALEWAQEKRGCYGCPHENQCVGQVENRWCKEGAFGHVYEWLDAYREHATAEAQPHE